MCQQQNFTAATGIVTINSANGDLNGGGPMGSVLTASGSLNGTVLQSITIKSTGSNQQGMIRFFIQPNGGAGNPFLWREIPVPANVQSETVPAYQTTIRAAYTMQPGDELFASTQFGDTWNIIAEAIEWENCACPT